MPKVSERQQIIRDLDKLIELHIIYNDDNSGDFHEFIELQWLLNAARFVNPKTPIPRNRSMIDMLWNYNEYDFKQETRMCRQSFKTLVRTIEGHPIFQNDSRHPQRLVWEQTYLTLRRLGCNGNAISVGASSRIGGVSFGSVVNYTNRVMAAIFDIMSNLIYWPDAEERKIISSRFYRNYGLQGAIGAVDGTHIILNQRPHIDGEVYFNRKQSYSINVQIVCDDRRMIRAYVVGWPGSVSDSTVFKDSDIYKFPEHHFSPTTETSFEYLIADAGFASESWLCTPYRQPAASIPHNKIFNELFSSARVVIEHVNGILKSRWSSLRGIRNQMIKREDFETVNKHIVVCMILHNFLLICHDAWDDDEDIEEIIEINAERNVNINARNLRLQVQAMVLNWHANRTL
jgi:hypothetical protein